MIVGLICAGGLSRRPAVRQPLSVEQIAILIERVTRAYKASAIDQLLLILGFEAKQIIRRIPIKGMKIVINPHFRMGNATSFETGMRYMPADCSAMVIGLGDMPLIEPETIDALIKAHDKTRRGIVYPMYNGLVGLPMIFDARYRDELQKLHGDVGPEELIEPFNKDAKGVKVKTDAVVREVATADDFKEVAELIM
jgi:molybdenum cofactor cytidylyltransferase